MRSDFFSTGSQIDQDEPWLKIVVEFDHIAGNVVEEFMGNDKSVYMPIATSDVFGGFINPLLVPRNIVG